MLKTTLAAAAIALGVFSAPAAKADTIDFGITADFGGAVIEVGRRDRVIEHVEPEVEVFEVERRGRGRHWDGGWEGPRGGWLTPREVRFLLREEGFSRIRFLDRDGRVYRAIAIGPRGRPVRVAVNARNGRILDVEPLRRGGGWDW